MKIRCEQSEDEKEIFRLTTEAFRPVSLSDGSEPAIVEMLRRTGDLTLSLVAVEGNTVLGHVAFSPVTIGRFTTNWFGLGPISVWPALQRQGIGSALIIDGLQRLRDIDANGCALIGEPSYYVRFGFVSDGNVRYDDVPNQYVQWISFNDDSPRGRLQFSRAFSHQS